jgi:hypothetical protein
MATMLHLFQGLHKYRGRQSEEALKKVEHELTYYLHTPLPHILYPFLLTWLLGFMIYGYLFRQYFRRPNYFAYKEFYSKM